MPDPYSVLGIAPDADDESIRKRYLDLAREFTPEQHPERFAAIRSAYEMVKDIASRATYRLFESDKDDTIEALIEEASCRSERRRTGLKELLAAAFSTH